MATSRGEIKGKILRLLNKTAANPGFYSDDKINDAVEEAMDFVSMEMFLADEGWQTKLWPIDTTAGQITLPVPEDLCMIKEVRCLLGDIYVPMTYDPGNAAAQYSNSSAARQTAGTYRIVDNMFYFNPALSEGNTAGIQVEGQAFPQRLIDDEDFIEAHFNKCMQHFIKYKAASILASSIEKMSRPWADSEAAWYAQMQAMVVQRNQQSTPIREFDP